MADAGHSDPAGSDPGGAAAGRRRALARAKARRPRPPASRDREPRHGGDARQLIAGPVQPATLPVIAGERIARIEGRDDHLASPRQEQHRLEPVRSGVRELDAHPGRGRRLDEAGRARLGDERRDPPRLALAVRVVGLRVAQRSRGDRRPLDAIDGHRDPELTRHRNVAPRGRLRPLLGLRLRARLRARSRGDRQQAGPGAERQAREASAPKHDGAA